MEAKRQNLQSFMDWALPWRCSPSQKTAEKRLKKAENEQLKIALRMGIPAERLRTERRLNAEDTILGWMDIFEDCEDKNGKK